MFAVVLYPSLLSSACAGIGGPSPYLETFKGADSQPGGPVRNPIVELSRQATYAGVIDSSESMAGLLKRLQIQALYT